MKDCGEQIDRDVGKQTTLKQEEVALKCVFLWSVNSTVTKHSDCFVGKDTSERVAWRCDDASWQRVSEFLCTQAPLVWGSSATTQIAQNSQKCSLRCATNVTFSKFRSPQTKHTFFVETKLLTVWWLVNCRINWDQTFWDLFIISQLPN